MKEIIFTLIIFVILVTIVCIARFIWQVKRNPYRKKTSLFNILLAWLAISGFGIVLLNQGFRIWNRYTEPPQETKIFKTCMVEKATDVHGKIIPNECKFALYYEFPFRYRRYVKFINFNDLIDKDKPLYYEPLKDYLREYSSKFTKEEAALVASYMNDTNRVVVEKEDF